MSPSVARVLAGYPGRPAAWLVDLPFAPLGKSDLALLGRAILETLRDGHREAIIKCLGIWSAVQAGTFSGDATTIATLRSYPTDLATRPRADSIVRAAWAARKGAALAKDATDFEAAIAWAKVFWNSNSTVTPCFRQRDLEAGPSDHQNADEVTTPGDASAGVNLQEFAMDLLSSYAEALETDRFSLYDHERQEVHAGLVCRAVRDVIAALGTPDLWCLEHGAHIGRMLVEVRIYLEWMALQEPTIYRAYQDFGAGKAKLYARIMQELPSKSHVTGIMGAVDELRKLSRTHDVVDDRIVDTRDSFAEGKSLREMAKESGLFDLYRQAYYISSGVAHSEWWSVETHCMERCMNVLHRGHLIPSLSLSSGGNVALAKSWIDSSYALMHTSLKILGTDAGAVASAFSWLVDDDGVQAPT